MRKKDTGTVRYTPEFRAQILAKLANKEATYKQIHEEHGVSIPTISNWRRAERAAGGPKVDAKPSRDNSRNIGSDEVMRLRQQIAQLQEERDLLRKGIALLVGVKVAD